ncbi:MAG TPA: arylesterase [Xanthomonadales bacterium]|nr:arylesterase [Xanthomonadales bacterium]
MIIYRKYLVILLALVLLSAQFAVSADNIPGSESQPRILVIGDSLSAAYNMPSRDAWPSLLETRLIEHGYPWQVFNSSITGDTTEGALARLPRLLERHAPKIVIIELGGNDGLRGLSPEVTRSNMAKMIEMSQSQGAEVLLTGIRIPPNYGDQYVRQFEGIYPHLAGQYDAALVPFFMEGVALDPNLMQADGIHPSVEAQPILLDNVWPALEPLLNSNGTKMKNE